MMPTPAEQKEIEKHLKIQEEVKKLKNMMICAVVIAFGAGFIAGAVLV
jgi:hypothetical protein